MSLFKRSAAETRRPAPGVDVTQSAPQAPAVGAGVPEIELFNRQLFRSFEVKAQEAARESRATTHEVSAVLRRALEATKGVSEPMAEGAIPLARLNLGAREEVAGQQIRLYSVLQRAMEVRRPEGLTREEALQSKGAIGATQVALGLKAADRGGWLHTSQEAFGRMERQLETLQQRVDNRAKMGLTPSQGREFVRAELDDVRFALQGMGFSSLPSDIQSPKPWVKAHTPVSIQDTASDERTALLAFVQGAKFSVEEGGAGNFRTARDVVQGVAQSASVMRQDPSVSPYLVADATTLAAFNRVKDALLTEGQSAGQSITQERLPELEHQLAQKMDPDLAAAIGLSTSLSAGQPFENKEVRDLSLALNGDPAFKTPEGKKAALKHLSDSPEVRAYREAAEAVMDAPRVEDLPGTLKTFEKASQSLAMARPAAMAAAVAMGWGPLGVMAAAAKNRPSASDLRDARQLAQAFDHFPDYAKPFTPGSKTYMEQSEKPGMDPKVLQVSANGQNLRLYSFDDKGTPRLEFQGPVAAAPVQEKTRQALQDMGDLLTRPVGRLRAAQAGLIDLQAPSLPIYTRLPWLTEPTCQNPMLQGLEPWGENGLVPIALNQDALREARSHA